MHTTQHSRITAKKQAPFFRYDNALVVIATTVCLTTIHVVGKAYLLHSSTAG